VCGRKGLNIMATQRSVLFCDLTHRRMVVLHRHFGKELPFQAAQKLRRTQTPFTSRRKPTVTHYGNKFYSRTAVKKTVVIWRLVKGNMLLKDAKNMCKKHT
jgi:hypothetical protein